MPSAVRIAMSSRLITACLLAATAAAARGDETGRVQYAGLLPGMEPLGLVEPLDEAMVAGIDRYELRLLAAAPAKRQAAWRPADTESQASARDRLREIIGAVDPRVAAAGPWTVAIDRYGPVGVAPDATAGGRVWRARYEVLDGVTADGLWVMPAGAPRALVIALPDAAWTPEQFVGLEPGVPESAQLPRRLVAHGVAVFVPTIIDRRCDLSGNPAIRFTNQPHREFIYRMAFELGRHVIGYEVQKVLAGVDRFTATPTTVEESLPRLPVGVCGVGEGGILALYAAALDDRIDATLVSGSFQPREQLWSQPIERNVWTLLERFGDAELAALVLPRTLVVEACSVPEVEGPPPPGNGRGGAAPGVITTAPVESVRAEFDRARECAAITHPGVDVAGRLVLAESHGGSWPAGSDEAIAAFLGGLGITVSAGVAEPVPAAPVGPAAADARHARQFHELVGFTQRILETCGRERARLWRGFETKRGEEAIAEAERYRKIVTDGFIGRLDPPSVPPRARCRKVIDDPDFTGHELAIDLHPDVFAGGILLVPTSIAPGERRAVVVCQHGLEGRPIDTIEGPGSPGWEAYKGFAAALARRGYVVYAPQNPYRGQDRFRTLQRKGNPLGLSLFAFIVAQHERTLEVLRTLPFVDPDRIGFYGLSYGGKTAMRVPALVPGYCLSICSADFNDWVKKNATFDHPVSYVFTGEYEIFEWNMGHVANYAELAWLIAPRPFMVERGHGDGVGTDDWVAAEFAKVRLHYVRIGHPERAEIEFFDGPHTINGVGTYAFLDRFLPVTLPEEPQP